MKYNISIKVFILTANLYFLSATNLPAAEFDYANTRHIAAQNSFAVRSELRNAGQLSDASGMLEHDAGIVVPLAQENEYILHEFRNLISKLTVWFETICGEWEQKQSKNESLIKALVRVEDSLRILSVYNTLKTLNDPQATKNWLQTVYDEFQPGKADQVVNAIFENYPDSFGASFPKDKTIMKIKMAVKMIREQAGLMAGFRFTDQAEFSLIEITEFFKISESGKVLIENADPDVVFNSDELALFMVLKNLIRNSLDAGAEHVIIATRVASENMLEIRVTDNGSGIQPKILPNIFNVGFTTKAKGIGSGLGLPLTKQRVEKRLNGDIGVQSAPGKGTRFTIRIPIDKNRSELRVSEGIQYLAPVEKRRSTEILSVFKQNGKLRKKGKDKRSVHRDGDWHWSVKIIVVNEDDGSVVFQKRFTKSNKPKHNGKLHLTVSGHVKHGESIYAAAVREFKEELGVRPKKKKLSQISEDNEIIFSDESDGRIDNERATVFKYWASAAEIRKMNIELDHSTIELLALVSQTRFLDVADGRERDEELFEREVVEFAKKYPSIFVKIFLKPNGSHPRNIANRLNVLEKRSELRVLFSSIRPRPDYSDLRLANQWLLQTVRKILNRQGRQLTERTRTLFLKIFGAHSNNKTDHRIGYILSYDLTYNKSFLLLLSRAVEVSGAAHPIFVVEGSSADAVSLNGVNKKLKDFPKSKRIQTAPNYADARTRLMADYGVREFRLLISEEEKWNLAYYLSQGFEEDEIRVVEAGDAKDLFHELGIMPSMIENFQTARKLSQFA